MVDLINCQCAMLSLCVLTAFNYMGMSSDCNQLFICWSVHLCHMFFMQIKLICIVIYLAYNLHSLLFCGDCTFDWHVEAALDEHRASVWRFGTV